MKSETIEISWQLLYTICSYKWFSDKKPPYCGHYQNYQDDCKKSDCPIWNRAKKKGK